MSTAGTWVAVVERYLEAYYDEHRAIRELRLKSSLATFVREFCISYVAKRYLDQVESHYDSLRAAAPSCDWEVIEKFERVVTVEIPVETDERGHSDQIPLMPTRLVLKHFDDGWEIADILHPCVGCNYTRRNHETVVGQCSLCRGVGHLPGADENSCTFCHGSGSCKTCCDAPYVGWNRAFYLVPRA